MINKRLPEIILFLLVVSFVLTIVALNADWYQWKSPSAKTTSSTCFTAFTFNVNRVIQSKDCSYSYPYNFDSDLYYTLSECISQSMQFTKEKSADGANFCQTMQANLGLAICVVIFVFIASLSLASKMIDSKTRISILSPVLLFMVGLGFFISSAISMGFFANLDFLNYNATGKEEDSKWNFFAGSICGILGALFSIIAAFLLLAMTKQENKDKLLA